jgi:O-antigen/teichoic acid export membrane protein
MTLVTSAFQMAWGPFAYSILHETDAAQVYSKVFSVYFFLGSWLCTGFSLFASLLLRLLTVPEYYGAASSVPFLVFSQLALGGSSVVAIGTGIVKKSMPVATGIFLGAAINTVLNFTLIPSLGKDGAAIATLVAYLSALVYMYIASQRLYPIPYRLKDALICSGFAALLVGIDRAWLPTEGWTAFGVRIGMCLLFVPLAFGLKIVRPEHVRQMWASAQRLRSRS